MRNSTILLSKCFLDKWSLKATGEPNENIILPVFYRNFYFRRHQDGFSFSIPREPVLDRALQIQLSLTLPRSTHLPTSTSDFKLRAFVEKTSSVTLIHVILQQVSLCTSKTQESQDYRGIASFKKTPFSKQFPSIRKRNVGIFKFLRFEGQTDRQSL